MKEEELKSREKKQLNGLKVQSKKDMSLGDCGVEQT
jgi:hypothetical protein